MNAQQFVRLVLRVFAIVVLLLVAFDVVGDVFRWEAGALAAFVASFLPGDLGPIA